MRIYTDQSVFDAALDRMRWVYREFEHVYVNVSGGKDSTVVLNLALMVAEEMGRLPVNVTFIDQEAEWAAVIEHVRNIMHDPRVRPYWYQMPIRIFNATSVFDPWLHCWEPGVEWIRPKEDISIKENVYGTDRFAELFGAILDTDHPHEPACHVAGVRCEESPGRRLGLTSYETYKGVTWGSKENVKLKHFTFYPIYDWAYTDVWKAIHDNHWPYCSLYDRMYQYGVPVREMRVSNVHHETAVRNLFYLQEIEPETWDAVTARLSGINTAGQLQKQYWQPRELPFMFKSWREYRDHLLNNLIVDEEQREKFRLEFEASERAYPEWVQEELVKTHIAMILTNDYHHTKMKNFHAMHMRDSLRRGAISGRRH